MHRIILAFVIVLSGCTTQILAPNYEQVWVNGFYINQETSELFVTARDTAYIFNIDREFSEALLLSRRTNFYPKFLDFVIDEKNQIKGKVVLVFIEPEPSEALLGKLKSLGFHQEKIINRLQLTKEIEGKRYSIDGELPLERLEKDYPILVAQPRSYTETAGVIIATPAAITIDAVVTVPAVFLAATVMVLGSP